jgi:alkylation response protein AidB-like acyl-CoA dehydrogenase
MDLSLAPEEEQLIDAVRSLLSRESPPERVRASEKTGFDSELWSHLQRIGVSTMAAGDGTFGPASLFQLVLVAEQCGAALASAPVLEGMVAIRTLTRCGERSAQLLASVLNGDVIATVSFGSAVRGVPSLVPAGAIAHLVLGQDGDEVIAVLSQPPGVRVENLGALPLAFRTLDSGARTVLATGAAARSVLAACFDEWKVLSAAQLVGVSAAALNLGVDYVKSREVFGAPIATFQTIAHCLADDATAIDGGRLLTHKAAWALDERRSDGGLPGLDGLAVRFGDGPQGHAGLPPLPRWLRLHHRIRHPVVLPPGQGILTPLGRPEDRIPTPRGSTFLSKGGCMNFDLDDANPEFHREVSAFLDDHVAPALFERCRRTGTRHDWDLHRALGARGWYAGGWPTEYGGRGDESSSEILILSDELERRGIPSDGLGMTMLVANVILRAGSEDMRRTVLPRVLAGEALICLGYTESHGGSDVADARTAAVRDGDNWAINGQKMFTTLAHEAQYVFLLTRTNPEVPKHRGLTMFLVPMDAPGVEVQPIWTIGDVRTNATYYTDVIVPRHGPGRRCR